MQHSVGFVCVIILNIPVYLRQFCFVKVSSVNKTKDGKFELNFGGDKASDVFDIVVVAAPQTMDKNPLQFFGFDGELSFPGTFYRTVATMVRGKVNEDFFGLSSKSLPTLFIVDRQNNINSVSREVPVDYAEGEEGEWNSTL